ncbi:MAG: hypothetical protein ACD_19C00014G0022 [uncultured bacterium]|nr:MAG: hypothetical protein ACD_19C00014G0022 [uncultured bacterium]
MEDGVLKRDVFDEVEPFLTTDDIIVLHGARQVGKTHILLFIKNYLEKNGKKTFFIDLEDSRLVETLDKSVDSFLTYLEQNGITINITSKEQKTYIFIDEIQYLENPSSFLKLITDHHKYLKLIVSGSSSFDIKSKFTNSLVGRTVEFEVYPLSFKEFLRFKGQINMLDIKSLYEEYILFGGYPKIVLDGDVLLKEKHLQQIIKTYVEKDISDLAKIRDIKKFNNLLKLLASQSGQLINLSQTANICELAVETVKEYISILEKTYVLKLVYPFSSSIKVEIVKTPKVFFYDTGLLQIIWLKKLQNTVFGHIFETSIFSELVKKFGRENINFWRNKNGTEIDFILDNKGDILPIEVKNNFSEFKKSKITAFLEKYKIVNYKVVGLEGAKKSPNYIYPWEI